MPARQYSQDIPDLPDGMGIATPTYPAHYAVNVLLSHFLSAARAQAQLLLSKPSSTNFAATAPRSAFANASQQATNAREKEVETTFQDVCRALGQAVQKGNLMPVWSSLIIWRDLASGSGPEADDASSLSQGKAPPRMDLQLLGSTGSQLTKRTSLITLTVLCKAFTIICSELSVSIMQGSSLPLDKEVLRLFADCLSLRQGDTPFFRSALAAVGDLLHVISKARCVQLSVRVLRLAHV